MADPLLWAYGLVARPGPTGLQGLEGRPVEAVVCGELAVLASTVTFSVDELERRLEDLDALERMARAHDGVLEAAMEHGAVVPFRMCTMYASPEAIRDMLSATGEGFAALLSQLRGKEEWGVKAFALPRPAESPAERPASGMEYLARRRAQLELAEAGSEALAALAADVHASLADHASAAVVSRPHDRRLSGRDTEMLLNGAYLIAREDAERFAALVDTLRRRHEQDGLTLELTGPWPPYHFVAEPPA